MAGITFGTTGDYLRFAAAPPVTAPPFTWLVAAVASSLAALGTIATIAQASATSQGFRLEMNASGNLRTLTAASAASSATTTNAATVDVPFTAIGRYTSDTDRYSILNGDTVNAATNSVSRIPSGIDRLSFGKNDNSSDNQPFAGTIFYSALWGAALNAAEIAFLARGGWPTLVRPASLVAFWPDFRSLSGIVRDWKGAVPLSVTGTSVSGLSYNRMGPPILRPPPLKRTQVLRAA